MFTQKLTEFVTETPADALPQAMLMTAQSAIMDTLGVTLAGLEDEAAVISRRYVEGLGATGISQVLGTSVRSAPAEAAFANGIAAHVLDFDDSLPVMRGHPSATLMPVVLAIGEAVQASGRDVLVAFALALEVGGRVGRGLGHHHYLRGWHSTATVGAFTATAAAARLTKMTSVELEHAWGIAASMTSGLVRNFGSMTKSFHTGHAARIGVTAAALAKSGFTSEPGAFEGEKGLFEVYGFQDGEPLDGLLSDLGAHWVSDAPGIFVKRWPCCYCNHRALGGLFQLLGEHDFAAADIEEIAVGFAPGSDRALIKDNPQTGLEAKFSIEYAMAAAVLDRDVTLQSFTDEQVQRPEVRRLMTRIRRYHVPAEGVFSGVVGFTDLSVIARGQKYEMRIDRVPGSPAWPMSPAERRAKLVSCAAIALGQQRAEALADIGERIWDLPSICSLIAATLPEVQAQA